MQVKIFVGLPTFIGRRKILMELWLLCYQVLQIGCWVDFKAFFFRGRMLYVEYSCWAMAICNFVLLLYFLIEKGFGFPKSIQQHHHPVLYLKEKSRAFFEKRMWSLNKIQLCWMNVLWTFYIHIQYGMVNASKLVI